MKSCIDRRVWLRSFCLKVPDLLSDSVVQQLYQLLGELTNEIAYRKRNPVYSYD